MQLLTRSILLAATQAPIPAQATQPAETVWQVETSDGVRLHGVSFGSGVDVLYLHGGPGFPPFQSPRWLVALADSYRVHFFHQRGSGRSGRPLGQLSADEEEARTELAVTYGIERQLEDVAEVREARIGSRPFVLVGHSFGGFMATLFAARRPHNLAALVLLAPADVIDGKLTEKPVFETIAERLPLDERAGFHERMGDFMRPEHLAGKTDGELALATDWFGYYFLRASGREIPRPDTYPQMRWSGGATVAGLFLDLREGEDRRAAWKAISAPTLVLHGAEDLAAPAASARYADGIRGAAFEELTGIGHFFDQQPTSIRRAVAGFLDAKLR